MRVVMQYFEFIMASLIWSRDIICLHTVLPRLVRMRTIKVMSFFEKKNPSDFEQFLENFGIFEQKNPDLK